MSASTDRAASPLTSVLSTLRAATIARWTTTSLLAVTMTLSGISFVVGPPSIVAMVRHLGYPPYLRDLIGIAKLLGVAVVVIPGLPTLREWAYAGFTLLMLAAISSHLLSGDGVRRALPAAFVLGLSLASRRLRR
jgi:uncharacterized membrane protein YphA (DoxX/SURF4 family)